MKYFIYIHIITIYLLATSCKNKDEKKEIAPSVGKLTLRIDPYTGDSLLKLNHPFYTDANDTLLATNLKFYVSQLKLRIKGTNRFISLEDYYYLVDQTEVEEGQRLEKILHNGNSHISDIPVGEYDQLSFFVGIPQERNHDTINQIGYLDPSYDMYWSTWHEYIFLKFEGKTTGNKAFTYHITGDRNLKQVFIDFKNAPLTIDVGTTRKVYLKFYIHKIFSAIVPIDVKTIKNIVGDNTNSVKMATNYSQSFVLDKVITE